MAQLSRPFQIALVAAGLLACVWFIALRGHSSSSSASGSSPSEAASPPAATQPKAASPGGTYTGSAPGVSGLTKAIAKAQGAVATSQQNAAQLAQKSAQASSAAGTTQTSPVTTHNTPTAAARATSVATVKHTSVTTVVKPASSPAKLHPGPRAPVAFASREPAVEAELARGDVVLVLFWTPSGVDDLAVKQQVRIVARDPKVAVQYATAREVAAFGTITRGVQLYATPTVLVLNRRGQTHVIDGLTDAYSLRQTVADARHG